MADLTTQIERAIHPPIAPSKFRVYLFGPSLQPDEEVVAPTGTSSAIDHAKYLRYATKIALQANDFTVDFGETQEILNFWHRSFKADDIGTKEYQHAQRGCGAIVMFPASIGAICELGLFTPFKPICEKTCIIVSREYEHQASFFRQGLVEVFEQSNGKVEFKNYDNHSECISSAVKFVKGRYNALLRDKDFYDYAKKRYNNTAYEADF